MCREDILSTLSTQCQLAINEVTNVVHQRDQTMTRHDTKRLRISQRQRNLKLFKHTLYSGHPSPNNSGGDCSPGFKDFSKILVVCLAGFIRFPYWLEFDGA